MRFEMRQPRLYRCAVRLIEFFEAEHADVLAAGGGEGAQRKRIVQRRQSFGERRDRQPFDVEHGSARRQHPVARRFRYVQQDRNREVALAPRHGAEYALVGQVVGAQRDRRVQRGIEIELGAVTAPL